MSPPPQTGGRSRRPPAPPPERRRCAPLPRRPDLPTFLALVLGILCLAGCPAPDGGPGAASGSAQGTPAEASPIPLPVWVSLPPQAWLAESVGGERVEVEVLLPPGASPHTYEPTPRQVVTLDRARLYLAVGHPHLTFERRLSQKVFADREDLVRLDLWSHAPGGWQPESSADPHVWLDPGVIERAAADLTGALETLDPAGRDFYRRRLASTREQIEELDRHIHRRLEPLPHRVFWVDHPAWGWFAHRYGLEQIALEAEGKEMSAARLVELTDRAHREGVEVIIVQKGTSHRAARTFAESVGAQIRELDPLARDWPGELRRTADLLAESLEGREGS